MLNQTSLKSGAPMGQFGKSSAIALDLVLDDIARNLSFDKDFNISHPAYRTWGRDDSTIERMERLTPQTRFNHLRKHLQSYLYGIYYNQSLRKKIKLESNTADSRVVHQDELTIGTIQAELFQSLHASNISTGYWDPGWIIEKHESDGAIAVIKNEFRLHVSPERHLESDVAPALGTQVAIRMPKNCFQSGFYVAVSSLGLPEPGAMTEEQTLVRIYFNLPVQIAPQIMRFLTSCLNEANVCFSYKSPCHSDNYCRSDAGVLYFLKRDYNRVYPILEQIHTTFGDQLGTEVPLFSKYMASGIGLAEDPWRKFDPPYESFGLNRCAIIAITLLKLPNPDSMTPALKKEAILSAIREFSIDPSSPYLNPGSSDIFGTLVSEPAEEPAHSPERLLLMAP